MGYLEILRNYFKCNSGIGTSFFKESLSLVDMYWDSRMV